MFLAKNRGKNTVQYKVFKDSKEDLPLPPSQDIILSLPLGSRSPRQKSEHLFL